MTPQAYPNPAIRKSWLECASAEDALEPELPIVDPHHHLWDRDNKHAGGEQYLLDEMYGDTLSGHRVTATVYVQAGWNLGQDGPADFRPVNETAAASGIAVAAAERKLPVRFCAGIVGYADLRSSNLDALLDAHTAAGHGRFKGIRQSATRHQAINPMMTVVPPPDLLADQDFRRGLRLLGARRLTFDAWVYHTQLSELADAARAAPETRIVVDHVGGPLLCGPFRSRVQEVYQTWLSGIEVLAGCPNVYLKLGGLGMRINGFDYDMEPAPPSSERLASDWARWIDPCIERFGASRCMFESNFPVDKAMFGYDILWNAFKRLAAGASPKEKAFLFSKTASDFYDI